MALIETEINVVGWTVNATFSHFSRCEDAVLDYVESTAFLYALERAGVDGDKSETVGLILVDVKNPGRWRHKRIAVKYRWLRERERLIARIEADGAE